MRTKTVAAAMLAALVFGTVSSAWTPAAAQYRDRYDRYGRYSRYGSTIPAGTSINVRLDSEVSTENANRGQSWTGTVTQDVSTRDGVMIPAGSHVSGVVTSAAQGTHETSASLGLALRRVDMNGRSVALDATTPVIVAGSHRAKKIGAIAGGAAIGALLGHTVAKGSHGTLIGGLLGGAAGYGLTRHAMRTLQLKPGTELTFTTTGDVLAYRR